MNLKHTTVDIGLLRAKLYKGIYSRVARRLGVSRSVVRKVAEGLTTSRRIQLALQRELRLIERELVRAEKRSKKYRAA